MTTSTCPVLDSLNNIDFSIDALVANKKSVKPEKTYNRGGVKQWSYKGHTIVSESHTESRGAYRKPIAWTSTYVDGVLISGGFKEAVKKIDSSFGIL